MDQYVTSFTDVIDGILKNLENKPEYLEIFSDWEKIVGKDISSKSIPHKVVNVGNKKILIIKSKKGCALELQHESIFVLEKIHQFFKKSFFDQIKIIQMDINDQIY